MNKNTGYFLIAFFSALLISSIVKAVPSDTETIRNRIIVEMMSPGVNDQRSALRQKILKFIDAVSLSCRWEFLQQRCRGCSKSKQSQHHERRLQLNYDKWIIKLKNSIKKG